MTYLTKPLVFSFLFQATSNRTPLGYRGKRLCDLDLFFLQGDP